APRQLRRHLLRGRRPAHGPAPGQLPAGLHARRAHPRGHDAGRAARRARRSRPGLELIMGRLLLVSNRLPVTVSFENGDLAVARSAGGLASGLGALHEDGESLWIGWPGETWAIPAERAAELDERLAAMRL